MPNNKLILIGVLAGVAAAIQWLLPRESANSEREILVIDDPGASSVALSEDALERAYHTQTSNVQVAGEGVVTKLLKDDNDGSRHQRFILTLASGRTLLVAHNIDLAARLDGLREGDTVRFFGEYEWNSKGGVLHWTHRDPAGRHPSGWLEHRGRRYE